MTDLSWKTSFFIIVILVTGLGGLTFKIKENNRLAMEPATTAMRNQEILPQLRKARRESLYGKETTSTESSTVQ